MALDEYKLAQIAMKYKVVKERRKNNTTTKYKTKRYDTKSQNR